jgi:SOS-response transcriptional repressor LexA
LDTAVFVSYREDNKLIDVNYQITRGSTDYKALEIDGDAPWELWPGAWAFIHTTEEPHEGDKVAVKIKGRNCIRSLGEAAGHEILGVVRSIWARVPK